ncbi:MAG: hypothetical protein IKU29_03915 [Parabacteroides sp.]|nr:hypothetical protein [Parabacteroides sp.]
MGKRIESVIFKGFINKQFTMSFIYNLEFDGKFKSISEDGDGRITIYPSYLLQLNPGYPLPRIYISNIKYFTFTSLLESGVKLVRKNLFTLFPNINKTEFEIDERVMERFQTEKALNGGGITIVPSIWVDSTNQCYPGLKISVDNKSDCVTLPLEDAIAMNQLFKTFDPNQYSMSILSQLIRIE